ncbi:MAG: CehA/McbA family metallohydrolase [Byssovorax sp.]
MQRKTLLLVTSAGLGVAAVIALRVHTARVGESTPPVVLVASSAPIADTASAAPVVSAAPIAQRPPALPLHFEEPIDVAIFQKGNIHTHSKWSDGDSLPDVLYRWYRDHGYNFLAVTDHNTRTDPLLFKSIERKGSFTLIPGEEVTMTGAGKQVHVNALCTKATIGGHHAEHQGESLAWAVQKIREQGGVALVNHPNFDWALTAADVAAARGAQLLEIASGHPWVHTDGDATHQSHEQIWDAMLTRGETFAGVAVDDAHHFHRPGHDPPHLALPGRAWIEVFADTPDREAICAALAKGRLYSSTGVVIKRLTVNDDTFTVALGRADETVEFLGKNGEILQTGKPGDDGTASYKLVGTEVYVRARITAPDGKRAWTQASRLATQ